MIYLDGGVVDFGKRLVGVGRPGRRPADRVRRHDLGDRGGLRRRRAAAGGAARRGRADEAADDAPDAHLHEVTDADIARQIADEHGLQADVDVDGPRYDVVQQLNQSDLAFLRERARLVQAELWCERPHAALAARGRAGRGPSSPWSRATDLLSVRLCADLAHQRSEVAVTGYDAPAKEVIDERAGGDVVTAEITSGRTGPAGRRAGARAAAPRCGCARPRSTSAEASAWAKAEMLRRARRLRHGRRHHPGHAGPGGRQPADPAARSARRSRATATTSPGCGTPSTWCAGCARGSRPSGRP